MMQLFASSKNRGMKELLILTRSFMCSVSVCSLVGCKIWLGNEGEVSSLPLPTVSADELGVGFVVPNSPSATKSPFLVYLKAKKIPGRTVGGLQIRALQLIEIKEDASVVKDAVPFVSGKPKHQVERWGIDSKSGSEEPLPQGVWIAGETQWGRGDTVNETNGFDVKNCTAIANQLAKLGSAAYDKEIPHETHALGPAFTALKFVGPGTTDRTAIGIHVDNNWKTDPGSSGCVTTLPGENDKFSNLKKVHTWLANLGNKKFPCEGKYIPLIVDWGLPSSGSGRSWTGSSTSLSLAVSPSDLDLLALIPADATLPKVSLTEIMNGLDSEK